MKIKKIVGPSLPQLHTTQSDESVLSSDDCATLVAFFGVLLDWHQNENAINENASTLIEKKLKKVSKKDSNE